MYLVAASMQQLRDGVFVDNKICLWEGALESETRLCETVSRKRGSKVPEITDSATGLVLTEIGQDETRILLSPV